MAQSQPPTPPRAHSDIGQDLAPLQSDVGQTLVPNDVGQSLAPLQSDVGQSLPPLHSDVGQTLPPLHSDVGQSFPLLNSDVGQTLPHLHSDVGQTVPHLYSDVGQSFAPAFRHPEHNQVAPQYTVIIETIIHQPLPDQEQTQNLPPPVGPPKFHKLPLSMICEYCKVNMITKTKKRPRGAAFFVCTAICFIGCALSGLTWFGCCLIPFCTMYDVNHYCSKCNRKVGFYRMR